MLENIDGSANSRNSIIIQTQSLEESQNRTIEVSESIRKHGIKFSEKKCLFNKSGFIFLGHRITGEGIFPDK